MRILLVLAILLSLAGCSGKTNTMVVKDPVIVEVPIPLPCPEPLPVARPKLPIHELRADSTDEGVAKAYAISIEILNTYAKKLNAIVDSYRTINSDKDK
jgi:hypothetical protein